MVININIPIEPKTKKNSQRIVRVGKFFRILPSEAYMEYEKKCRNFIPELHIDEKVNIKAVYYMKTRRRVDLCNLHEALCDVLVKYGCIEDDNANIVASMDGSYVAYDKENPRTVIVITSVSDN